MFLEKNVIEFINKIINESKEEENELKSNLEKFKEYLILTKMSDKKIVEWVNIVNNCLPEIIALKKKIKKNIDIISLIELKENEIEKNNVERKVLTKMLNDKMMNINNYNYFGNHSTSSNFNIKINTRNKQN